MTYVICGVLVNQTEISVVSFLALFLAIGVICDAVCWHS